MATISNNYTIDFQMLDDNYKRLKFEVDTFKIKGRKRSAIDARAILLNIKKLCHTMRQKIYQDMKNMPIIHRNISKETLEKAAIKRKQTNDAKKKGNR